ncbi:MAG: 50S ribosomal protein L18 [Patescibacteria group bacterium]|nr:50S ribosomal protein L18 [Patescibacteria group bacterium]
MKKDKIKNKITERRKKRVRSKILGTLIKPRLSIFRSNKFTYAQLIDDINGKTLASVSTRKISGKNKKETGKGKQSIAEQLGELIFKKAAEKNITSAVFDRGSYNYHGRVKAVAESARKAGLKI